MRAWQGLWRANALLLAVMMGCSGTPRGVRIETNSESEVILHIPRTGSVERVEVPAEEVTKALRAMAPWVRLNGSPRDTADRLLQLDAQYGDYLYLLGERKLVPQGGSMPLDGALTQQEQQLVSRYKAWCRSAHGYEGDCLGGALVASTYLDARGRYLWAMALSKSPVLEEFQRALGEMVSLQAVMQAAMCTLVTLLVLLAMPEPVTKVVAAWATAALIVWVGASTLYHLITGWFELMKEVKEATTFDQIREAGERFGRLFSREAAQAFAMIAMALLTHTAKGFGEQVATLPGSARVSMQAAERESLLLSEVSAVEEVLVTRWALDPRFERLFARAGIRLKDDENVVHIGGHKGPHPRRYHELVYRRLDEALGDCATIAECKARVLPALDELARKTATPGTELNRLVTLGQ